jgi:hypothetical protein
VPSIGDPNAGPHPATLQMLAYMPCTPFSCKDHPSYHRVSRGWSCHDLSTEVFLTCYFSARSPERHPLGCIVLRKWSSSTDKHIYCTISHVHLGYSVVIMRSVTISPRSIIQQQRLVYSFNTFTNTSFDAQNIVSELLSSPKACHDAPANQLHPDAS